MFDTTDIIFKELKGEAGSIGLIGLNRPHALNALTYEMCCNMNEMLARWSKSNHIKAVIIYGVGDKAFSAGGDIVYLYHQGQQNCFERIREFFRAEYTLNYRIHYYNKPFIALLDGITMGGGVGVSIHGSHRVVTERFIFAMPETAIGFFPDIGGSYFLSRCPGETGVYFGLTGIRLNASEAIYVELADHFVASNNLPGLIELIANTDLGVDPYGTVSEILQHYSVIPETPELAVHRHLIDKCFSKDSVEEIFKVLEQVNRPWADETLQILKKKSPTSLKVTLREIREGIAMNFESCMQMEYRLCQRFTQDHDFYEGVRAVLIDKDYQPYWNPDNLEKVTVDKLAYYFTQLPEDQSLIFNKDVSSLAD